eukprot:ctg_1003.g416
MQPTVSIHPSEASVLASRDLERARVYLSIGQARNAAFFADRARARDAACAEAFLVLARCHFLRQEPRRAVALLGDHARVKDAMLAAEMRLLLAECYYQLGEYDEVSLLADNLRAEDEENRQCVAADASSGLALPLASLLLVAGKAHEAQENAHRARECYLQALRFDPLCVEAVERLCLGNVDVAEHVGDWSGIAEAVVVREPNERWIPPDDRLDAYYRACLGLRYTGDRLPSAKMLRTIQRAQIGGARREAFEGTSTSVLAVTARQLATAGLNSEALGVCEYLVQHRDALDLELIAPLYLMLLAQRGDTPALFRYAHRLVDAYPRRAQSWYAVALYYYANGQYEACRPLFQKATMLDPTLAYVWVAYGHAFAVADESDQAMAAYRTAMRLAPSESTPLLYVGVEFARQNHSALAHRCFERAMARIPVPPAAQPLRLPSGCMEVARPCNEIGVARYRAGEYADAVHYFERAVRVLHQCVDAVTSATDAGKRTAQRLESVGRAHRSTAPSLPQAPAVDSPQLDSAACLSLCQAQASERTGLAYDVLATVLVNLGHAYCRVGLLNDARRALEESLAIGGRTSGSEPYAASVTAGRADAVAALGYVAHLAGDLQRAAELYHIALRERAVSGSTDGSVLLSALLERALDEMTLEPLHHGMAQG